MSSALIYRMKEGEGAGGESQRGRGGGGGGGGKRRRRRRRREREREIIKTIIKRLDLIPKYMYMYITVDSNCLIMTIILLKT